MLKVKMLDFIVAVMDRIGKKEVLVSGILDAFSQVSENIQIESYENIIEGIFETVLVYPEHLELTMDCRAVALRSPDLIIDCNIPKQLQEYLRKCSIGRRDKRILFDKKQERFICEKSEYMDWLWDKLSNIKINTSKIYTMYTAKDIINISMIPNLFDILSRYYKDNLLSHHKSMWFEEYMFIYTKDGENRCFGILKDVAQDCYKVAMCEKPKKFIPHFANIASGTLDDSILRRRQLLKKMELLFKQAQKTGIEYESIQDSLKNVYRKD